MPLLFNVPYSDKDDAKRLGACWNPDLKMWYVQDRKDYYKFLRWLAGDTIVSSSLYIVEGVRSCYRCGSLIPVVGFGFETFENINYVCSDSSGLKRQDCSVHIGEIISRLPRNLEAELALKYNLKRVNRYGEWQYSNHCHICGAIQGNYFLFDEVDSPFFIDGAESAKKLTLHRIRLPYDIAVCASIGVGSSDCLIRKYSAFVESEFEWK